MAVSAASVTVDDDPEVALNVAGTAGLRLIIENSGAETAVIGHTGLALADGFELLTGAPAVVVELEPGDVLFALSTAAGTTLKVLRT